MTRKDYEHFANMLASHVRLAGDDPSYEDGCEDTRMDIGRSIAAILKLENPNFDAVKFYEAAKL